MPAEAETEPEESQPRISAWWLLVVAIATGAVLTALAGLLPGSPTLSELSAVEWLGTTATIAALVIAVGIYRLQERSSSEAHAELMAQLEAQSEILQRYAEDSPPEAAEPEPEVDPLSAEQRAEIEARFGADSIAAAIDPGRGRGRGAGRARLVRLRDGRLVSVYSDPRRNRTHVREVGRGR